MSEEITFGSLEINTLFIRNKDGILYRKIKSCNCGGKNSENVQTQEKVKIRRIEPVTLYIINVTTEEPNIEAI